MVALKEKRKLSDGFSLNSREKSPQLEPVAEKLIRKIERHKESVFTVFHLASIRITLIFSFVPHILPEETQVEQRRRREYHTPLKGGSGGKNSTS